MSTPSQPSPTNLSDELTVKLQSIIRMASRIGADLMRNQNLMDEAVRQITAAYAEAIRSAVPEKHEVQPDVIEIGGQIMDYEPFAEGFNAAIDTFTTNLKNQGLLPNGKDGDDNPL